MIRPELEIVFVNDVITASTVETSKTDTEIPNTGEWD